MKFPNLLTITVITSFIHTVFGHDNRLNSFATTLQHSIMKIKPVSLVPMLQKE